MRLTSRNVLFVGGIVSIATGLIFAAGEPAPVAKPKHDEQLAGMMLAKLASSQKIVSGLVSEDFEEIRKGAEELNRICQATEWAAHSDQIYAHHRQELRRQAVKLAKLAEDRNLDGAAFTYMHSLTTCISCHQHCRDVLRISDDLSPMDKIVPIPVTEDEPQRLGNRPIRR